MTEDGSPYCAAGFMSVAAVAKPATGCQVNNLGKPCRDATGDVAVMQGAHTRIVDNPTAGDGRTQQAGGRRVTAFRIILSNIARFQGLSAILAVERVDEAKPSFYHAMGHALMTVTLTPL